MIKITVQAINKKSKAGNTFLAWRALKKDGKAITLKFTRDVQNIPREGGWYDMFVDPAKANINNSGVYPVLWVKGVEEFKRRGEKTREEVEQAIIDMFACDAIDDSAFI